MITFQIALDFSEILIDLLERIPYLRVFISTLLPRFDDADKMTMSNPNNVRKVMNVEICSRLSSNASVVFINNDTTLEWWKDEVKRNRLFSSDGHRLTAFGFSVMLDHWTETLKSEVAVAKVTSAEAAPVPARDESETKEKVDEAPPSDARATPSDARATPASASQPVIEEHVLSEPSNDAASKLADLAVENPPTDEHVLTTDTKPAETESDEVKVID